VLALDREMSPPLSPSSGGLRGGGSSSVIGGGDANRVTAEKLAQVQEIMRQRLHSLQDEQHRQWQRVQEALRENMGLQREAAEQQVQRSIEAALDAQVRPLMGELASARREFEAQSARANATADDLAALRHMVEYLQAQREQHHGQLNDHTAEIERLKLAHQECARRHSDTEQGLRAVYEALAKMRAEHDGLAKRMADVLRTIGQHGTDIDDLRRRHEDCARARAETAQQQRALNDVVSQLKAELEGLSRRVADVPGLIRNVRDEVVRIAERAARDICERMRPEPVPVPSPAPKTMILPEVSEEAYAVLRNSEGEQYELPGLQNVVGRSAACNAVITHSQAISNRHASVDFDNDGRVSVRDLNSRNGTFLNDRRCPQDAGIVIHSGDSIRLGVDGPSYTFEFGPAYYARWPAEPVRVVDRSTGRERGVTPPPASRNPRRSGR